MLMKMGGSIKPTSMSTTKIVSTSKVCSVASTRSTPWINKAGKPYISVYGMASRLEHWQLSMPCQNNQYHYRTMLPKLALVDLQDRPVKLITEKGTRAVFTQVFLDFDELEEVKANPIAAGFDALDRALNQVRAQLDQSPIDPEWRTPQTKEDYSQTPSVEIGYESLPNE